MKKIALIGANGQLSTDIRRVFDKNFFEIIPLTHQDIEITDIKNVEKVLEKIDPDIVINTAAYHRVDEMEDNREKAFLINAEAQKNLSILCQSKNRTVVYISTDYVFGADEKRSKPYKESDAPGPINIYGESKLAGEKFTRENCKKHFIIRGSGLFGVAGASGKGGNFVELMIRLGKEKGAVKVVNDQVLTPTATLNIAENLNELLKTDAFGLYHMTSQGQCSWYEFAGEIFKMTKMKVKCEPVDSDHFPTRAKRPKYSVLDNESLRKINLDLMKDWRENLKLYLKEKKYI